MQKPISEFSNSELLEMYGYAVSLIGGDDDDTEDYSLEQIAAECLQRMSQGAGVCQHLTTY